MLLYELMPARLDPSAPDFDLGERFALREEVFSEGQASLRMLLPQSAEDLLDEEAFQRDERMPYWADLWPSAKALARWLLRQPAPETTWIELGCGVGLPSLVVKSRGGEALATDHNEDALQFVRANARRNGLGEIATALFDWRERNPEIGRFDVALAADVLYEQRNAIALQSVLPRIIAPGGQFILADPGRRYLQQFQSLMKESGWACAQVATLVEAQTTSNGESTSTIRILQFTR